MIAAGDYTVSRGLEGSMDYFAVAPHGMATTHLDALCHVFFRGRMYNGFDKSEVRSTGARRNSIMAGADGIVSRGVLLDLPALRGVEWLEPDELIHADDLDAAERREAVTVSAGDVLLVGTGRDARRARFGPWAPQQQGLAGLAADCIPWLRERDVAVLGCDGISDAVPSRVEGWPNPIHQVAIVAMGVHLIDNMQLGRLAAACAERRRWEFLFTLAPLRLERGTASPVNPIAMF
jgi:kynurenine formamidase